MNVQIAAKLLNYFSYIHFIQESQCCKYLICLPLFQTVDGTLTAIEGKIVYIWPKNICKEGTAKWLSGTNVVFLKPSGEWKMLGVDNILGIHNITAEQTYVKFIFPNFSKLSKKERYAHLSHIRDRLFNTNFVNQQNDGTAFQFVSKLTKLPCIGDDDKPLQPVRKFHTHKKVIFRTFPEHFQILPDIFLREQIQWMQFFENIGLQKKVSPEVYIKLCGDVAHGKMKDKTRESSKVLLNYLFSKQEAECHEFHGDPNLLAKISDVPFVCPPQIPELEWIKKVPQASNSVILGSGEEVSLCKLAGSCPEHFKDFVWAVKPIVPVREGKKEELLKLLGIGEPTAEDVLMNVKVLAKTCFADPKQFMKYTAPHCQQGQKELMDVMAIIFEHLQTSKTDMQELKSLPCIPVYAMFDGEQGQFPVLVRPECVVFRPREVTRSFHPFIHSLERPLHRASELLERLGVQNSLELKHMQIVLELAFKEAGSMEIDPNTREVVTSAMQKIESLLIENRNNQFQRMGEKILTEKLTPLYLLGTDDKLHPVDVLVHTKIRKSEINMSGKNLFLLSTPEEMFPEKFCELLPNALRPKPLSELCTTRVSTACKLCEGSDLPQGFEAIKRTLKIPNLTQGMFLIVKSLIKLESVKEKVSSIFLEYVTNFFGSLEIRCVKPLKIDMFLKDDETQTKIASEHLRCYIEENQEEYHLYIDRSIGVCNISDAHDLIAGQLLSCLRDTEFPDLNNLQNFLSRLLRSENSDDVYNYLQECQISCRELANKIDYDHKLTLGAPLPASLHFRLDQSSQNIFKSQELVGYQPIDEDHNVIVAQVVHAVCLRDDSGKPLKPMHIEYIIITSEDDQRGEGKRVKAIEIFKFIRGESAPKEAPLAESDCQEVVVFQGNPDDTPPPPTAMAATTIDVEQGKDEVRQELEEIWHLEKDERKKAIKRLYLKWHPDKNPRNQEAAEEVFKFLLQELDRREKGASVTSSYSWRTFQRTWDSTAHQHRQFHNEYQSSGRERSRPQQRPTGGTGFYFFDGIYTPPRRETEAKRWVRQALADSKVLKILLEEARVDKMISCHVCFMAHEVAEKALKGAMYATCGLRDKTRENHNIIPLACTIEQEKPEAARGLAALAQPLEPTYYRDTRFPKQNMSSSPPCDNFTLQNAEEAETCAAEILKIVQYIVVVET